MKRSHSALIVGAVAILGAASVAVAGNRATAPREDVAPLAEHVRGTNAGYTVQVHPAFSSRVQVEGPDGEVQLYRQQGTFDLPAGETTPPAQHVVRLQGGAFDRDIGLVVSDPKHQIARITIEMYGPEHQPGVSGDPVVERVIVENTAVLCPPHCL